MGDPLDGDSGMPRKELDIRFEAVNSAIAEVKMQMARDVGNLRSEHAEDMKVLRNGAQASLMTSWQLNGDPQFNIEGFIPKITREIGELRSQGNERDAKIAEMAERQEVIADRQEYIKRMVEYLTEFFRKLGKIADWRIWVLGAVSILLWAFPNLRNNGLVLWVQHIIHGSGH